MPAILVVDDTKAMRDFVQFTLAGFEEIRIEEAGDGANALGMLRRTKFDLVLLDLYLPVLGGMKVLAAREQYPLNRDTPIVVVTALQQPLAKSKAQELGAHSVLEKPLQAAKLIEVVRQALALPDPERPATEARKAERLRIPVEITIAGDPTLVCTTWDISPYGAFVATDPVPVGTRLVMVMALPQGNMGIHGVVAHTSSHPEGRRPAGFGIKFDETPETIGVLLDAFVLADDDC